MFTYPKAGWRAKAAIALFAGLGALYPVTGMAQQAPGPSGAAVEVGGVSAHTGGAVQGRPVVLPNTGGGPGDESTNAYALAVLASVLALSAGTFVRYRGSRRRVGG